MGGGGTIFHADVRLVTHERAAPGQRRTIEAHLPERRRELRHRSQSYWDERAEALGAEVGAYIREVFASDDPTSMLRESLKGWGVENDAE